MSNLHSIFSICLQGDVQRAYQELQSLQPKTKTLINWEKRYSRRFFSGRPLIRIASKDPWIRNVIQAYIHYFVIVLTKQNNYEKAEAVLAEQLRPLVHRQTKLELTLDEIEEELERQFQQKGYNFLGGYVGPIRGPFIWKRTERTEYQVQLPDHVQPVTVYYMHDFLLSSWLHFATFGKRSAGGWAKEEGLYCVHARYKSDMEKDSFQVSYLKHEAQHFWDYQRFPGMDSASLEYRAKLIELAYYSSHKRLFTFLTDAQADSIHPHPFASYKVMEDLAQYVFKEPYVGDVTRWKMIPYETIQQAALALFQEHTNRLLASQQILTIK